MSGIASRKYGLAELNALPREEFSKVVGGVFEHSPWIALEAAALRPFTSLEELHSTMTSVVAHSAPEKQLDLIRAHPDLAGRLARQGQLTAESAHEQAAAGLGQAPRETLARVEELNAAYKELFQFPFIICARLNNVETILAAMESRLNNTVEKEISTALEEIAKIARLRLADIVET